MAEGIEEADSNSGSSAGDATMLSAAMPCEVRDFGAYHNQAIKRSVSISTKTKFNLNVNREDLIQTQQQHERSTLKEFSQFEPMSTFLQLEHRSHTQQHSPQSHHHNQHHRQQKQQRKRKADDDDADDDRIAKHRQLPIDDDQLSHSSCSSLAPLSPQQQPINLKSEEFDEDFNVKSHGYVKCENMSPMLMIDGEQNTAQRNTIHTDTEPNKDYVDDCEQIADDDAADKDLLHDDSSSNILKRMPDVQSQDVTNLLNSQNALALAAAAAAASNDHNLSPEMQDAHAKLSSAAVAHINGTMQKMFSLQNFQNLATFQQQKLSLVGLAAASCLNSPLNLSLGSSASSTTPLECVPGHMNANCSTTISNDLTNNLCGSSNDGYTQLPQLILASGQIMQGVQVAQLLIPSTQGIATQTILTIPMSQQVSSSEQLAQTIAASNNFTTNQQALQHQKQHQGAHQISNILASASLLSQQSHQQKQQQGVNANLFPSGVQQLLAAIQPTLLNYHEARSSPHQRCRSMSTNSPSPSLLQNCSNDTTSHHTHSRSPKHSPGRTQSNLSTIVSSGGGTTQTISSPSPITQYAANGEAQKQSASPPHHHSNPHAQSQESNEQASIPSYGCSNNNDNNNNSNTERNSVTISSCGGSASSTSSTSHIREQSPTITMNNLNRLTTPNGELTITKSSGLPTPSQQNSTSSKSMHPHHHQSNRLLSHHKNHSTHHQTSTATPTATMTSAADPTTDDDADGPTINQTNCNVVDGIDLDEIKEFAKAFKLRRLSLGLTQTQVGQALSVTEGPAYSQSAICSALAAAQMYAAQLSSQQQPNMFEKLDITPKSAQKIKPVLERWMKEAEERHWNHYKSGQNHLTDFIGVEPSKKRKRRTSFTPQALELLNAHFERNTHPSGTEITGLAHQLGYEREVIRIWFCNKRQALKNTVRMMSKGMV